MVAHVRSKYNGNCAIAKNVTGKQVTAYIRNAAYFSLSLSTKKCPAQKEINTEAMDTKSDVKPSSPWQVFTKISLLVSGGKDGEKHDHSRHRKVKSNKR